ncbi:MAG: dihydroorotase [Fuerstiella sp.]|nr:dihydroorotase [Fuerstiella sp.]
MQRLLITNGRVIDPANDVDQIGSLLIEDGCVIDLLEGTNFAEIDAERIDADGLLITPGFVDLHVGVGEPGFEEDETIASAALAAVAGGITSMATLPTTNPVVDNRGAAEFVKHQALQVSGSRVFPMGAVTSGAKGESLAEIGQLVEADAIAFSDGKLPIANAEIMRRALEYSGMFDRPIMHNAMVPELSESGIMHEGFQSTRLGLRGIPAAAQDIMTSRDIALAELTGGRVHIMTVTTMDATDRIRMARQRGIQVSADVTPHHLLFDDTVMSSFDTLYKVSPPLRTQDHTNELIEGLKDGTITAISGDHQPLAIEKKAVELDVAPFGICALETLLCCCVRALIEPKHLTWPQLLRCLTVGPAEILGVDAGRLSRGCPADVTLIDPTRKITIDATQFRSRSRNTPFDGQTFTGAVIRTLVAGKTVYERQP